MASPQKENGYTAIANEILEKIISSGLNGTELSILLHVWRKTYGFQKKQDEISLSQFLKAIPVSKQTLCTALSNLQLVKILRLVKKGSSIISSNLWEFNKNYDEWQLVKKSRLVKVSKPTSQVFHKQLVKKPRHTKETIQKKTTKESIQATPGEHKNIISIMELFKKINPTINHGHRTNRKACTELIKQFGLEPVKRLTKYAVQVQGKQYAPTITTPYQLQQKLAELKIYSDKSNKSKMTSI
jgi:phage replication O-like protein O